MPVRIYRTEIAGCIRVGIECDSELELQEFLGRRGIVLLDAAAAPLAQPPDAALPSDHRGRPSRDEEIAAAIDALEDELDRCSSIKAQARAVRTYLQVDGDPPALSTIETYISVYRRPRKLSALKIGK